MTFLQPYLLWGLPLVLLPLLIHLFNRMRYRPLPWAAIQFLMTASRQSARHARLRHLLILFCRMLAVAAFVVAFSRPLVGGWLGWAMSTAPDTIILLLDRSASMELQDAQTHTSKRALALRRFADAARQFGRSSRFVLIENALRAPQEISTPSVLPELSLAAPTDTAADIPALLEAALDTIAANQCGKTELWLASDLQASNWRGDDRRWESLRVRFGSLPQSVRVRLLALTETASDNLSVCVRETRRQRTANGFELLLAVEINRAATTPISIPLTIAHEGARSVVDLKMDGQSLRVHHRLDLGAHAAAGWGWVELPPDANPRDNRSYFAYGEDIHLKSLVVADPGPSRRLLQAAAAPAPERFNQSCTALAPADASAIKLDDVALVIWQAPLPTGTVAERLQSFEDGGGVVLFLPVGQNDPGHCAEMSWAEAQTAGADKPFRIGHWRNNEGPLAQTQDGKDLPLRELTFARRQSIVGDATALASFEDGKPFLARRQIGKGSALFCAALPQAEWSNLGEGTVLVPMMQRLLQEGGRRLSHAFEIYCGDETLAKANEVWSRLDRENGSGLGDPRTQAGSYQAGGRMVAVNRPPAEDAPEILEQNTVRSLFGTIPLHWFEERGAGQGKMESELWRMFLVAMLVLLTVEAFLALPGRGTSESQISNLKSQIAASAPAEDRR